jgi:hypothetical protein
MTPLRPNLLQGETVMRLLIAALLLLALLTTAALAQGDDKPARKRCELCNMYIDISTTRIEAEYKTGGKSAVHNFESLGCLYQTQPDAKAISKLRILDYSANKLIDGKTATYLYGTKRLKGSMAPFIAAFGSKDAATKAKAELGGDVMNFNAVWSKLADELGDK